MIGFLCYEGPANVISGSSSGNGVHLVSKARSFFGL